MQKYNSRKEVPEKYKWNLTDFFKDDDEFNECFSKTEKLIKDLNKYVGCTKDANLLYEFIEKEIEAITLWDNLYTYAHLINDQELGVSESIERKNRAENLNTLLDKNISFFAPELLKLNHEEYEQLFKTNPKLELYRHDLDNTYREKEHILTENEEIIVSELVNSMNHFSDMSSEMLNSEHNYGKIKLSDGTTEVISSTNYRRLSKNPDRGVRKRVRKSYFKTLDQYGGSSAAYLNAYVSMRNSLARIHHFSSSWEAKLFANNMPDDVYKTLVKVTESNLKSLHRYYEIKKKALNLDVLYPYDLNLDMANSKMEYSIEDAQDLIRDALRPLGDEYLECFEKIIDNRYIDYCQYKGKRSGGYSSSTFTHDSRILMSYNYDLTSVSTIIHEAGHNIHHQLVKANNPIVYRGVPIIVAEVASLTNECLLSSYLAKNGKNDRERLAGIANILNVIVSNLYGSVREGKLEQDFYNYSLNGGTLTQDYLDKINYKSLKKYYGDSVKTDKSIKNTWITRLHYFMNFYLYSYAVCISVASFVAKNILDGNKKMLDNYLKFLKTGSDIWPIETFKILGVDLTDENVYIEAIKYFDSLLDEFETISNC